MKQLKITLKMCAQHWREWCKALYRDYLLLALTATLMLVAVLLLSRDTLLPLWVVGHELGDWQLTLSLIPVNVVWVVVLIVALVAMVWSMIRAHRAMRCVVGQFSPVSLGRQQKAAVITLLVMLMIPVLLTLWLPTVTLMLSALAAAYSGMMQDAVPTPVWMWMAFVPCGIMAVTLCEVAMTFCRLCLRTIPEKDVAASVANSEEALPSA